MQIRAYEVILASIRTLPENLSDKKNTSTILVWQKIERNGIINMTTQENAIFRTDTKALVGAVIVGIVFVIACQATGVIDHLLPWG